MADKSTRIIGLGAMNFCLFAVLLLTFVIFAFLARSTTNIFFFFIVCLCCLGLLNALAYKKETLPLKYSQSVIDIILISSIIYLTGGILSPLLFLYIFEIVFLAVFWPKLYSLSFALWMIAILSFLYFLGFFEIFSINNLLFYNINLGLQGLYVFSIMAFFMVYFISFTGDKLRQKNDLLESALREKTELTNLMAHELRTPLASIYEYMALIIENYGGAEESEQKKYNTDLMALSKKVLEITSFLLDISRIESGKAKMNKQSAHLVNIIKDVIEEAAPQFLVKNIYLLPDISPSLPKIRIDEENLHKALAILLADALKHTASNSTISLSSRKLDRKNIIVEIKNQGLGLNSERLEEVFDKVIRAEWLESAESDEQAPGLELALGRAIIYAHGGKLWAERKEGNRVAYKFTLPV